MQLTASALLEVPLLMMGELARRKALSHQMLGLFHTRFMGTDPGKAANPGKNSFYLLVNKPAHQSQSFR